VKFHFEVIVTLKEGLLDPQGKAIEDSLPHMGWTNVSDVRVGKHIELELESETSEAAEEQAKEMAQKLLSNPVIESFEYSYRQQGKTDGRQYFGKGFGAKARVEVVPDES